MSLKAPAIPEPKSDNLVSVVAAIKENIEVDKGRLQLSEPLRELAPTATLSDVISSLNIIIRRLNS